jgi:hypothetical protein
MKRLAVGLLACAGSFILASCIPTQISGASAPTEHTFPLKAADVEAAADTSCYQAWVTGDPQADLDEGLRLLAERKVKIVEGNPIAMATALKHRLLVAPGFAKLDASKKSALLAHELVHYCQRDTMGSVAFEQSVGHSAGRWRIEVPAYAQSLISYTKQGAPAEALDAYVEETLQRLRDNYWLHDIQPGEYERETRKIWTAAWESATAP